MANISPDTKTTDEMISKIFDVVTFTAKSTPGTATLYTIDSDIPYEIINYTMFQPSDTASTEGILVNEVMSGGRVYLIRKPITSEVGSDVVKQDWLKGIFTTDEADYLNSLNIRPDILKVIFGGKWLIDLANFMDNMVSSNCFSDVSITTQAKCDVAANFVEKVFEYFMLHDDRIAMMQDEEGMFAKQAAADMVRKAKGEMDFNEKGIAEEMAKLREEKEAQELRGTIAGIGDVLTVDLAKDPFADNILKNPRKMDGVWNRQISRNVSDVITGNSNWVRTVLLVSPTKDIMIKGDLYVDGKDIDDAHNKVREKLKQLNSKYPMWMFE